MIRLLKWLTPLKDNQTIVILIDGRRKACSRTSEGWLAEHFPDHQKQAALTVTFAGLTAYDAKEPKGLRGIL